MSLHCPSCHSRRIESAKPIMKAGIIVGTLCGAARGALAALAGNRTSMAGPVATPLTLSVSSLSAVILRGLTGAISGCALGAQLGEQIDRHSPTDHICLSCGTRFNLSAKSVSITSTHFK